MRKLNFIINCSIPILISCGGINKETKSKLNADQHVPGLGVGVNFSETKTFGTCLSQVKIETNNLAFEERLYRETRISSSSELHKTLNVSASASAIGTWGSGGGSFSYFKDVEIDENGFYWLVDANYSTATERINTNTDQLRLTEAAKKILKEQGLESFHKACGTHFYVSRDLGARYTLLYEFNSKEDKVVERLKAKANYSGFGVKASGSFESFLSLARKSSILKVHSHIIGGGPNIKDYAENPELLKGELQLLRDDVFNHGRGKVKRWSIASYEMFPEYSEVILNSSNESLGDMFRKDALAEYFAYYTANKSHISKINKQIELSKGQEPLFQYSEDNMQKMVNLIELYRKQNSEITRVAKSCVQLRNNCPVDILKPIPFDLPKPDLDLRTLAGWKIHPVAKDLSTKTVGLEFIMTHDKSERAYWLRTSDSIFTDDQGIFILANFNSGLETFYLGIDQIVIDPNSGDLRIGLCLGDYEDICDFRVIDRTKTGSPHRIAKAQLLIYDDYGFIKLKRNIPFSI